MTGCTIWADNSGWLNGLADTSVKCLDSSAVMDVSKSGSSVANMAQRQKSEKLSWMQTAW